ncbi:hypothetical protein ACH5RR_020187 [Cinchona calisaya]|uniref:FLZ-type domain-containing protein n=1 Tax=Cinchona calisaya TaxID=153742 RepID=A0ABD2ZEU4_9GENT
MGSTAAYKYMPSNTFTPQPGELCILSPQIFLSLLPLVPTPPGQGTNPRSTYSLTLLLYGPEKFYCNAMKRNRVATEDDLTHLAATSRPQPPQRPPPPSPQNQPKVQERAEGSIPWKLGDFLERCHYCKKYMPPGLEVYMYRDFCGFCSVGCRDIQISLDKLAAKQVALAEQQIHILEDNESVTKCRSAMLSNFADHPVLFA